MERNYNTDRKESDRYLDEIKRDIVNEFGDGKIVVATDEEDMFQATDLVYFSNNLRICFAVRTRDYYYYKLYPREFTLRTDRFRFINQNEFQKVLAGYGDYLYYCFITEDRSRVSSYSILNLFYFRQYISKNTCAGLRRSNRDHSSNFIAFNIDSIVEQYPMFIRCQKNN